MENSSIQHEKHSSGKIMGVANVIIAIFGIYLTFLYPCARMKSMLAIDSQVFILWSIYSLLCFTRRFSGSVTPKMDKAIHLLHQSISGLSFAILMFYWLILAQDHLLDEVMESQCRLSGLYGSLIRNLYVPFHIWFELLTRIYTYHLNYNILVGFSIVYSSSILFISRNLANIEIYDTIKSKNVSGLLIMPFGLVLIYLGHFLAYQVNKRIRDLSGSLEEEKVKNN